MQELRDKIIEFRNARDWAQYHNPKDLAISLSLEAGELLELFQWKNQEQVQSSIADEKMRKKVKEELGDIFIYALILTYEFDFDPEDVICEKLQLNEKKYPVEKCRGKADKYTEY